MFPALVDYCEGETFRASCRDDEVIVMKAAKYGRMGMERCVKVLRMRFRFLVISHLDQRLSYTAQLCSSDRPFPLQIDSIKN